MDIFIISSDGTGSTLLSAFDAALLNAGVHNYNLLLLSSVIPHDALVVPVDKYTKKNHAEHGYKLYVVQAKSSGRKAGTFLGASVGWYMMESGGGFFVEHHYEDTSHDLVNEKLKELTSLSLKDLVVNRGMKFEPSEVNMQMSIAEVGEEPACALVTAIYKSESWS